MSSNSNDSIIQDKNKIEAGDIYQHSSGITYHVDELLWSADEYEETGLLPEAVIYTQLEDGKVMPAGTRYTRTVSNFLKNFKRLNKNKQKILVLAYPGIGKTYMAENYDGVMDFEQQHYRNIYDEDIRHLPLEEIKGQTEKRKPNPEWPNNFIKGITEELEKNDIVITTFIPSVYEVLCRNNYFENTRVILAVFDKDSFEELVDRFRARKNVEEFIERRRADFPVVIKLFEEAKDVEKVVVESGEYLADALTKQGLVLKLGKGKKNYY